MFLTPSKLS